MRSIGCVPVLAAIREQRSWREERRWRHGTMIGSDARNGTGMQRQDRKTCKPGFLFIFRNYRGQPGSLRELMTRF
jgi:hypothetical protein